MEALQLETTDDLVRRLARENDPVRAIIELIWNSLDAEATRVVVCFARSQLGAITRVLVKDNGHGIHPQEIRIFFGRLGDSWKVKQKRTQTGKRLLHGSRGEGRLRAFALGQSIQWESIADDVEGNRKRSIIVGRSSNRKLFEFDVVDAPAEPTGCVFAADNTDNLTRVQRLDSETARDTIAATFAPILIDDKNITIEYDETAISVADQVLDDTKLDREVTIDRYRHPYKLRIIEWKSSKVRRIYFAAAEGRNVHEEDGREVETQYFYSAYITWSDANNYIGDLSLKYLAPSPVSEIWQDAEAAITSHFSKKRRTERVKRLQSWKLAGVYPYRGEPKSEAERV